MKRAACFTGHVITAIALAASAASANALVITPSFVGSFSAAEKASINSAIAVFQSTFSDAITVRINFTSDPTGLGGSNTWILTGGYGGAGGVRSLLLADSTTATDATAYATLGAADSKFTDIVVSTAQCRAIGGGCGFGPDGSDGTININTTLTDADRSDGIAAGKYDMMSVVMHEIDEVLGSGSWLGNPPSTSGRVQDLFRYDAAGARTYTTVGDDAFLSLDGGLTHIAQFNQTAGPDYGDFKSCDGFVASLVQNACGTPGVQIDYSAVEAAMMDVLGYDRITAASGVPEPASALLVLGALMSMRLTRRTRR